MLKWYNQTMLTAVRSFALLLAVLGICLIGWQVRSYWVRDFITGTFGYFTSESGRLVFVWSSWDISSVSPPASRAVAVPREFVDRELGRIGGSQSSYEGSKLDWGLAFGQSSPDVWFVGTAIPPMSRVWSTITPHSLPGVVCLAGSATIYRLGRLYTARWRKRRGLCIGCGYDLRSSTARCPECGAAMTEAAATG